MRCMCSVCIFSGPKEVRARRHADRRCFGVELCHFAVASGLVGRKTVIAQGRWHASANIAQHLVFFMLWLGLCNKQAQTHQYPFWPKLCRIQSKTFPLKARANKRKCKTPFPERNKNISAGGHELLDPSQDWRCTS